jgi:hypothetical protein
MRRTAIVTLAVVLFLLGGALEAQDYPPAFPRPTAKKLLETDRIVVWDIVWPNGTSTPMHRHVYDQVGTYYQTGGRIITTPDGTPRSSTTPVGALSTTKRGTTHIEAGATDPPLRAVFVEMKQDHGSGRPEAPAAAPAAWEKSGTKPLLDDARVIVSDYTWTTGATATSTYTRDTIVVWLSGGRLRLTPEGGAASVVDVAPGHVRQYNRGAVETTEVVDGSPRAMIFSFK